MKFIVKLLLALALIDAGFLVYYIVRAGLGIFEEAPLVAVPLFATCLFIVYALIRALYAAVKR